MKATERINLTGSAPGREALLGLSARGLSLRKFGLALLAAVVLVGMALWSTPADAEEPAEPVWSADMTVVEYSSVSVGAASVDLFSNTGGSGNLRIRSLWSHMPDRDLRLAFDDDVPNPADYTLQTGDRSLEFPEDSSGASSFKWNDMDVHWEDGQLVHERIVPTAESDAHQANTPATGVPTISGTAQVGETLAADTSGIGDADGLTNVSYAYQWIRTDGGTDSGVTDATDSTYMLTDDGQGKPIELAGTFNDDKGNSEILTMAARANVGKSEQQPQFLVSNLDVNVATGIMRPLGAARSGFAQAFTTGTKTDGYALGSVGIQVADFHDESTVGDQLQVTINGAGSGGEPGDAHCTLSNPSSFSAPGVIDFAAPAGAGSCPQLATETTYFVVIEWVNPSGTGSFALIPQTYPTAESAATEEDPGGAEGWSIADQSYYLTVSSDARTWAAYNETASFKIRVRDAAAEANSPATGLPTISGTAQVGQTLTAHTSDIDDADGLTSPGYEYQWLRIDAGGLADSIPGATSATYAVQAGDVGRLLRVRVSFTDDDNTLETLTSDATEAVIVTQVTVSFGAGGYAAEEGGERATVKVMLDKDPHRTLRIPLHAATGGGAGPPDYAAPAQVTFRPGETEKEAQVAAADDRDDDDGESVTLAFGDLPDGVSAGSPSETVVQFIDDDYVRVTLGWEETAYTAEEPTSPGATTVTLRAVAVTATDKRPESGFALAFTVNTANGTARQPEDYEEFTATETFDRNDFTRTTVGGQSRYVASADFTVTVAHDTVDEPLERFTVRLAFAGSRQPHLSLGEATATVTVTDDVASLADLRTTVFADAGAVEPGGQLTYQWSVDNSGPAAATSTVLTGTLDAGVTFVSAQVTTPATGQCGRSGRTVTCTVGTLEVGDTASGEVVVAVKDDASADMGFTAVAGADQLDRTPADNDDAVTTALVAAPGRITNLRATGGRRAIDLTWSPPGDNGSAVTGYALERKAGTDDFLPVFPQPPQGTTSYRDEGVAEGAEYTYRLRAVNEDGAAAWSNEPVARLLVAPPHVSSGGGSSGGGGGGGGGFGPAPVAPKFADGFRTARTVAHNARAGDAAGDPVAATHPEDLAITYTLSGTDAAAFTVDPETGQVRVKDGVERELGQTYTVNLTATDSAGFGAIIIVVIEVGESLHHRYDLNGNGVIEKSEVLAAIADYFAGRIEKTLVLEVVSLYFAA